MSAPPPWCPEDFDDPCGTCHAPPGQLCRAWCDTGYTAADARADAERHAQSTAPSRPAPKTPASRPKE